MFGIKSVHEDGMFYSSNRSCVLLQLVSWKRGTIMDQNISRQTNYWNLLRTYGSKGAVEWAAVVKPGRIMFEVGGVPLSVAEALRLAAQTSSKTNS
jgi:large subunit ribosomal protein L16